MEYLKKITDGEPLKISKYASFIERDSGDIIIYSSLSGLILHCSEQEYIDKAIAIRDSEELVYCSDNPLVVLLYEHKVLVTLDFDEDIYVRSIYENNLMRASDLKLMLIVTRDCNFDCAYCGQRHENMIMQQETYDAIYNFIEKSLLDKKYELINISFFGGEPLLGYSKIVRFLQKLKRLCEKLNVPLISSMTTNGYLLTSSRFEKLVTLGCKHYQITVDGTAETHNKTRYLRNGKGTWEKIMENLKYAISTDYEFSITLRTNYNMDIANVLDDFYRYVEKNLKDDRIFIYFESIKDHGNENCPETINKIEEVSLDEEISSCLKRHSLKLSNVLHMTSPLSRTCYASKPNFFIIDYDSSVKKCSHRLNEEFNKIGILNSDGTLDLDKLLHAKWIYSDYLASDNCKNCKILPLCMGKKCPCMYFTGGNYCMNTADETDILLEISSYV